MSEDQPKRGRGRPRVVLPGFERFHSDIHTDRQIQARWYALKAERELGYMPDRKGEPPRRGPDWLLDWEGADQGKMGAKKVSVLEQLGRLLSDGYAVEEVAELADTICKKKLSAKDAADWVRAIRLRLKKGI